MLPGLAMVIAVENEGVGAGPADLAKTLTSVHAVGVGWYQQAAGAQLDAMTRAHSKRGPVCRWEGLLVTPEGDSLSGRNWEDAGRGQGGRQCLRLGYGL